MSIALDHFQTANYRFRKVDYAKWHRLQSNNHILRSQLGFCDANDTRPTACQGCMHYHGVAYGQNHETRTVLICGFHPYGWHQSDSCPDWHGTEPEDVL